MSRHTVAGLPGLERRLKFACFSIIALLLLIVGCTREKDLLDEEVKKLCAADGGVKVYEQVKLPKDRFDEFGVVTVPHKSSARESDEFFYEWKVHYYQKGNPEMWQSHFLLVRQIDGKLLGEAISYSRRGGDFPGPWHDSSFRCPADGDISFLQQRVFIKIGG